MAQIDLSVSAQETSNWEAIIDELLTLKSIYCEDGECEIISPTNLSFENLSHNEPGQSTTLGGSSVTIRVLVYVPVEHQPTGCVSRPCFIWVQAIHKTRPQQQE